ncbi:MAG: RNA polymerase sigma factor [Verrucomicrobiae bacterium]|nr:RNA polymerase sigma factor [Verrucomicrobiae bacterium]
MKEPAMSWVRAARDGDEDAATHLVRTFTARIYAFLRRLGGSESDAVELTQQTFCRAWTSLGGFEGRSTVSSWLHRIAYRTYVDWLRSDRRFEARGDAWWHGLSDGEAAPDDAAVRNDTAAAVYAAVDRLEQGLRETVHLHYYQELTLEETAEAMGIAVSTVKFRVRDAVGKVRRALAVAEARGGVGGVSGTPVNLVGTGQTGSGTAVDKKSIRTSKP